MRLLKAACALGLVCACRHAWGESLVLKLDGSLAGRAGDAKATAALGPGAKFVPSAEGQGVEPGETGHAVIVPVPEGVWRSSGTLAFRFRASRDVRINPAPRPKSLTAWLVQSPVLDVRLIETRRHPQFRIAPHTTEKTARGGRLLLGHLKGGQWYHLALAWDAPTGRLEVYLNGAMQQYCIGGFQKPTPWQPSSLAGELRLGGRMGEGEAAASFAVDEVQLWPRFLTEQEVQATLAGRKVAPLSGEGRYDYPGALDLSPYKLALIYEADFSKPLNAVHEDTLFEGERRARLPEGRDWVLEGPGKAWTDGGRLHIESLKPTEGGHVVLWSTRTFPADFLLEFGLSPQDSAMGLNIVFFCATAREGGGIFDLGLPRRSGVFRNYHSGALNCYHTSYWAVAATGLPRRTANLRKNHGFFLPACGIDRIAGQGAGPHKVRLLKIGSRIGLETRGRLSLAYDDDGKTYGPIYGAGRIGLRQMGHTHRASYTSFKVWQLEKKQ